ncbi:hypothetical protein EIKCOROL_00820 [Eikenella corrodens ATCC 23834]|uniref:Uncharacterized protein n=1 Tax=Eikenella corrodens ATCC 23834 TaxID=546274 RepID=C0DTY9_EIKCO|nr:hypothetical protein EIKCOROL_00820 [Eikenella corrodens ATCC 23834]
MEAVLYCVRKIVVFQVALMFQPYHWDNQIGTLLTTCAAS